ncbi:MAG: hypothetical protein CVU08_02140 [Bacteroidetes bacterium HGW-Bacteroidetes-3]|nr:MAG: hypothetical protein CVU08_02140 [Bacteroidetes bacterium HGW-Bacteroidetes-3]
MEVGSPKSEDRRPKTEVRRPKFEDGRPKKEVRRWKFEDGSSAEKSHLNKLTMDGVLELFLHTF